MAIALFIGVTSLLIGLSIRLEGYPAWLGIVGAAIGAVALTATIGLYLRPSLFPGALLYGVLASVVPLWLAAVGAAMLRRANKDGGSRASQTVNQHCSNRVALEPEATLQLATGCGRWRLILSLGT